MSRYSLWNPFFFSAYHDPRTFKGDTKESKSESKSDNKPAVKTTTTAQPKSQAAAKDEPTFKTLAEASAAGYHGQAVNIEGKGLQKVEFADKSYNDKMANVSANANSGKTSVASSATTQSKSTSQPATKSTVTQSTVAGSTGTTLSDGTTSLGQVSETGQYAGDGYVWHKNDNTNGLTRVKVEGDQFNNGLGTDVITGGTADKDTKEAVAAVSLNEGTGFADSKASATDGSVLDLFRDEENQVGSSSFADQVGVVDYTPVLSYSSSDTGADIKQAAPPPVEKTFGETFRENLEAGNKTFEYKGDVFTTELAPEPGIPSVRTAAAPAPGYATMGIGEAGRGQPELRVSDQEDTTQRRATEEDLFEQPVVSDDAQDYLDTLGTDFDFTQFDEPSIDYTVSQGEAGRGGSDSAAPTFSYQPNIDPVKETLVSLKNTAPETLTSSERLIANEYERERGLDTTSPTSTVSVTPEVEVAGPVTQLPSSPDFAMPGTQQAAYAGSAGPAEIGGEYDPRNILPTSEQMAEFEGTAQEPVDLTPEGNLFSDILKSAAIGVPGEASQMFGGLQDIAQARPVPYSGNIFTDAATEILLRAQPEATREAILSQTPEQAAQRGQGMGAASEFLGDISQRVEDYFYPDQQRDLAVVTGTTPGELAIQDVQGEGGGAGLANVVAEETGGALGTDIPLAYMGVPGRLASAALNFGEQISGGESTTRQALNVLEDEGVLQNNPVFQDALAKQGGDVEAAKDAIVRANVFQSGPMIGGTGALDAVVPGPGRGLMSFGKNIATRSGVEGAQEMTESALALNSLNNVLGLPEEQKIGVFQDASGNTVMGMLTGGATTTVAAPVTAAASAANQAITNKMNADATAAQFVPTSPTVGQVAQAPAGVESSYDQEAQGAATTMERVAAQEIIDNVKAEEGTISPQILQNLQNATGLSMQELSDMASDSVVSLGNFSIDPAVGRPTASDLQDQPTGIGGGSNIAVEPLPSGDTLLRNNDTGRTTVVNQGDDLAAAIQTFDEVTTPFVDTRNPMQLTADMRVGAEDTGSRINFQPTAADQAPMMPTTTRDTDVDLSGIASRLNLTDAQSLGPTTPDLSGIASNLNLSLPETPAIPADPATPSSPLATIDTTMSVGDTVNGLSVSDTLGASTDPRAAQLSLEVRGQDNRPFYDLNSGSRAPIDEAEYGKPGFRIVDNGDGTMSVQVGARIEDPTTGVGRDNYTSASMILPDTATQEQQRAAINEVANTWQQNYAGITSSEQIEQGAAKVQPKNVDAITTKMDSDAAATDVAAEVEVDETPVFTSVRADQETTETPVFSTVRDTDTTEDTIVELDETPVFTSVRGDTTEDTDEGVTVEVDDDAQGELDLVQVEDRKTTIPSVTSTRPETTTATDETTDVTTDTDTTTDVKVLTETGDYPEPEEEPEVEVEEPVTETEPDAEPPTDIFVPPVVTTDDDGNEVTECPEGYRMVTTGEGPMCMKSFSMERQRAGAGTRAYTGLAGNIGRRGPGQRRKVTTQTQQVRPTVRRT
jgi:hypothetical protein